LVLKISDEKGNKTTYTSKQGKELPLPGVISMSKFLTAIDSLTANGIEGEVEHFGTKMTVLAFDGLQGKKLKVGLNQYENFYNGEMSIRNDIKYWMDEVGKNSKGEDISEKVIAKLEENPLKKLKNAPPVANTGTNGGSEASTTAESGW